MNIGNKVRPAAIRGGGIVDKGQQRRITEAKRFAAVAAPAPVLLGRSAFGLAPTQNLRHIFQRLEMLRISLFGAGKRRLASERYAKCKAEIFFKCCIKYTHMSNIDSCFMILQK
jgi:hypothetical protein